MRARFEESAVRLLRNIFRTGLFENPYLDVERTATTVGRAEFMAAGYDAQLRSIVLLRNRDGVLPLARNATVFMPRRFVPERRSFFGSVTPAGYEDALELEIVKRYFDITEDPGAADAAIVVVGSPEFGFGTGYSQDDVEAGGNGYMPISLQYGPYTARHARAESLAGGDPLETFTNRSYRGKTTTTANAADLQAVLDAREAMGDRPVIVVLALSNPAVAAEFEPHTDAVIATSGVQDQAVLDILSGANEPSGLLPLQMPADMRTVEEQYEDTPHDMRPYVDGDGNAWDFAFGLNWSGVIRDARTEKYGRRMAEAQTP